MAYECSDLFRFLPQNKPQSSRPQTQGRDCSADVCNPSIRRCPGRRACQACVPGFVPVLAQITRGRIHRVADGVSGNQKLYSPVLLPAGGVVV